MHKLCTASTFLKVVCSKWLSSLEKFLCTSDRMSVHTKRTLVPIGKLLSSRVWSPDTIRASELVKLLQLEKKQAHKLLSSHSAHTLKISWIFHSIQMKRTYFIKYGLIMKKKVVETAKMGKKKTSLAFYSLQQRDFRRTNKSSNTQRNLSQENSVKTMEANKLQRKEPITISSNAI